MAMVYTMQRFSLLRPRLSVVVVQPSLSLLLNLPARKSSVCRCSQAAETMFTSQSSGANVSRAIPEFTEVVVRTDSNSSPTATLRALMRSLVNDYTILSAYDIAWVALIPAVDKSTREPQFPLALRWILLNQLPDGSWGRREPISRFDQISSTLACLIAIRSWNCDHLCARKGQQYLLRSLYTLRDEDLKHVPDGMIHTFGFLLEKARTFRINLPYSTPRLMSISRAYKDALERLPSVDSTFELSKDEFTFLESFQESVTDWSKVQAHQSLDGSFFSSPAATACVLQHTGDSKALQYLSSLVNDHCGAAEVHPNRLVHLAIFVDHLKRLEIAHYFPKEMKNLLDTLYSEWHEYEQSVEARASVNAVVNMGMKALSWRLLREHGYNVRPGAMFRLTKEDEKKGDAALSQKLTESLGTFEAEGISSMLQLNNALEFKFPGESLLDRAKELCTASLVAALPNASPGMRAEIEEALTMSSFLKYRSVLSAKFVEEFDFSETYSQMPRFLHGFKRFLLALAKETFNKRQKMYLKELQGFARWYADCRFSDLTFARQLVVPIFFTAVGLPHPENTSPLARSAWAQNAVLSTVLDDLFDEHQSMEELRLFTESVRRWDPFLLTGCSEHIQICSAALFSTVDSLVQKARTIQGRDLTHEFRKAWQSVISSFMMEREWTIEKTQLSLDDYLNVADISIAIQPIVTIPPFLGDGQILSPELLQHEDYTRMEDLLNRLGRLLNDYKSDEREIATGKPTFVSLYMRENPDTTLVAAKERILKAVEDTTVELKRELLLPSAVPQHVKEWNLCMMRSLYLMYNVNVEGDGFSNPSPEQQAFFRKFLFTPIPGEENSEVTENRNGSGNPYKPHQNFALF